MPLLGLGVYKTDSPGEMRGAVAALEAGYRSFDTAQRYGNKAPPGEVLQSCGAPREDLSPDGKPDLCSTRYDRVLSSFEESLSRLCADRLDLFFIHRPDQQRGRLLDARRAMERLYEEGRARGVCNCTVRRLEWLLEECRVPPAVNQVERHPLLNETALYAWCSARRTALRSRAPRMWGKPDPPPRARLAHAAVRRRRSPCAGICSAALR